MPVWPCFAPDGHSLSYLPIKFLSNSFPEWGALCSVCAWVWAPAAAVRPQVRGLACLWCQQLRRLEWVALSDNNWSGTLVHRGLCICAASTWRVRVWVPAAGLAPHARGPLCLGASGWRDWCEGNWVAATVMGDLSGQLCVYVVYICALCAYVYLGIRIQLCCWLDLGVWSCRSLISLGPLDPAQYIFLLTMSLPVESEMQ